MVVQAGACEQGDRAFRVSQPEAQRGVHIGCRGEPFIQAPKRGVVIGAQQPIQDPAREVVANGDFEAGRLEGKPRAVQGMCAGVGHAHQFHEFGRGCVAKAKSREANDVVGARIIAQVNAQALVAQFDRHEV